MRARIATLPATSHTRFENFEILCVVGGKSEQFTMLAYASFGISGYIKKCKM